MLQLARRSCRPEIFVAQFDASHEWLHGLYCIQNDLIDVQHGVLPFPAP